MSDEVDLLTQAKDWLRDARDADYNEDTDRLATLAIAAAAIIIAEEMIRKRRRKCAKK